jgi:type IV secretion system protein VirB10
MTKDAHNPAGVERDKHADIRPRAASVERSRKIVVVGVATVMTSGMLWLQWSDKATVKAVPRTQIRQSIAMEKPPEKIEQRQPVQIVTGSIVPLAVPVVESPIADPMFEAARRAPVLAVSKKDGAHSHAAAPGIGIAQLEAETEDKGAFEKRLRAPRLDAVRAGLIGDLDFIIPQGTSVPCTLETAMQSDQPGFVTCVVPRDVLSASGRVVLLERGTQVVGEYRGGLRQGQVRLHVLWSRARTPKGVLIELASPGTDALGRAGSSGNVDNHWFERFGSALLLSVVGDAAKVAAKAAQASTGESLTSTGHAGTQAASIAVEQSINIPPTLHKHHGEHVSIMVARDLNFSSVYALQSVNRRGDAARLHREPRSADQVRSGGGHGRSTKD